MSHETVKKIWKMEKEQLTTKIKSKLQEYWVNELHLPLEIQLRSMAIIDMVAENE
jgi:hypothetical protein